MPYKKYALVTLAMRMKIAAVSMHTVHCTCTLYSTSTQLFFLTQRTGSAQNHPSFVVEHPDLDRNLPGETRRHLATLHPQSQRTDPESMAARLHLAICREPVEDGGEGLIGKTQPNFEM